MDKDLAEKLLGGVEYNAAKEKGMLNDAAINDGWLLPSLLIGGNGIYRTISPFVPYINDIVQGLDLLVHKPYNWMSPEEYNAFGQRGVEYFKKVLNPQSATNKNIENEIHFPNRRAGESDYKYMEQYPLLRKNIEEATKDTYLPPRVKINKKTGEKYTRQDAKGFHNLKVRWKGKDYDYQIKDNAYDKYNDFYNIKPYEYLDE